MELAEKVVVVTGGASGIGRALAHRFAEEGAAGVVVADLDADLAGDVATEVDGRAVGVGCDVADAQQVADLIGVAEQAFGPVDLFCANAGIGGGAGMEGGWEQAIGVNVMAHVHAAQRLVPGWLERGEGYFLSTASAAGLLTQVGSAQYSVSKHAAVAFSEWLSVTYGDRGVRVSCLCPMGVNTPMLDEGANSGDSVGRTATAVVRSAGEVLEPEQVADVVVEGIRAERFLILPHPEVLKFFQHKGSDYDRWIAGMRRVQAAAEASG
jgi:hypothetical protein